MNEKLEKRFSFKDIENELTHEWNKKNIFKFKRSRKLKNLSVL